VSELGTSTIGHFPLTQAERAVVWQLAIQSLAHDTGVAAATIALGEAAGRGRTELVSDGVDAVALLVDGEQLLTLRRDFVRRAAAERGQ
jgi:hypothetical protein